MLDGSLLFENIVENEANIPKNTQSRGKPSTFLSLVTNAIISRHSCKISREYYKFLNSSRNISKIAAKLLHNAPRRDMSAVKLFLAH